MRAFFPRAKQARKTVLQRVAACKPHLDALEERTLLSGLISYYPLEGNALDPVGGRNGTLIGGASFSNNVPSVISSFSTQSVSLDGNTGKVIYDVPNGDSVSGSYTVAMWVNDAERRPLGTQTFFGTRSPVDGSLDFKFIAGDSIRVDIGNGTGFPVIYDTPQINYNLNTWYHVALTVTPTEATIYFDGNPIGSTGTGFTPVLWDANHDIAIGGVSAGPGANGGQFGEDFNGLIDDVRIYNYALSPTDIKNLSQGLGAPDIGPPAQLVFGQQPTNATAGNAISPPITVDVKDANGNPVTTDNTSVTLSVASGPGALSGTVTVAAVNGVATFPNLVLNQAGTYTLQAADSTDNLSGFVSGSFTIAAPVAPTFTLDTPPAAVVGVPYSYQFQATGTQPITFSATGLPAWAQLNPSTGLLSGTPSAPGVFGFAVTASNGTAPDDTVNISLIAAYAPPTFTADAPPAAVIDVPYTYQFQTIGPGPDPITYSATGLPGWAHLSGSTGVLSGTPTADGTFNFSVTASNGVAPSPIANVFLTVSNGTANTFNVAAGSTFTVPSSTYTGGTTFNVGAGATVTIDAGTFTGGAVFSLGSGAVVDIIDSPMFSGLLTGSGSGIVQVFGGRLYVGSGGLTLDFSGNMFEWTGGQMDLGTGNLTNLGTMTITAPVDFYNDGVLYNYGTLIQTGTGNLQLGTDGNFPATLLNEAGASYLLEGDGGLTEISDSGSVSGQTALNNAGIIRKTAGTGISSIGPAQGYGSYGVFGAITNTGVIEADSGTIALNPTLGISQVAGSTLTGGTWNALNGASLQFPSGTAITSNQGKLTLSGTGANIIGIAGLASNSGTIVVTNGKHTVTAGSFTNSGSITIGPGSSGTVAGNFTQTSTGTLIVQIGGSPASGQFGQVAISGIANLAGTFQLNEINGFVGAAGQDFTVMTYASQTGLFSTVLGFGSTFTEAINPTSFVLDAYPAPADLQVSNVSAPTTTAAGQPIAVTWQVTDPGPSSATGSWQDSVYVSPTATITSNSILLGTVQRNGGLNANGSYTGTLSTTVPALEPGSYYVLVQADSLYQVPDPDRANSTAAAAGQLQVTEPSLGLGTPLNGSFTAANQNMYFGITIPANAVGKALVVTLSSAASSGSIGLYLSGATLPTPYSYSQASNAANKLTQTVTVPTATPGVTYYVLAQSVSGNAATSAFTVTGSLVNGIMVNVPASPYSGGNNGSTTIEITGANFSSQATASLTLGKATINASAIQFVNSSQLFATFNLSGAAIGSYALEVMDGGQTVTTPNAFNVTAASAGNPIKIALTTPSAVRAGRTGVVSVTVTNTSNSDAPAPLLQLTAVGATLKLPSQAAYQGTSLYFLATSPTGLAGILTAGESVQVAVQFQSTTTGPSINFQVNQTNDSQPINLTTFAQQTQPAGVSATRWTTVVSNLASNIGTTWGDYDAALAQVASRLALRGQATDDPSVLLEFLVTQAEGFPVGVIGGQVVNAATGQPLVGVTVQDSDSAATVTTDDTGSFTLTSVSAGTHTLSLDGYVITSNPTVTTTATTDALGVQLFAAQAGQISGTVTAASNSQPLANIPVECIGQISNQVFEVTTAADGSFSFDTLPADTYSLTTLANGYVRSNIGGIAVALGQTIPDENFSLVAGASITGRVTPAAGGPTGGTVQVAATPVGTLGSTQNYFGSATGDNFSVNGLPAGSYNVSISLAGYIPVTLNSISVATGATTNVGVNTLSVAGSISGAVVSANPAVPAAGETVALYNGTTFVTSTTTDSNGAFEFSNLSPATYTLSLSPSVDNESDPTVTVTAGSNLSGADITVPEQSSVASLAATAGSTGAPTDPTKEVYLDGEDVGSLSVTYSPNIGTTSDGMTINADFSPNIALAQSDLSYEWVQVVTKFLPNDSPPNIPPFLDPADNAQQSGESVSSYRDYDLPFYWSQNEAATYGKDPNTGISGTVLSDGPSEASSLLGASKSFQTYLVAYSGMSVYVITGFSWGFSINSTGGGVQTHFGWLPSDSVDAVTQQLIQTFGWIDNGNGTYSVGPAEGYQVNPQNFSDPDGNPTNYPFVEAPGDDQVDIPPIPDCASDDQDLIDLQDETQQAIDDRDDAADQLSDDLDDPLPRDTTAPQAAEMETDDYQDYIDDRDNAEDLIDEYTEAVADAQMDCGCTPTPPGPDPTPPTDPGPPGKTPNQNPEDPNALIGPDGYGVEGFIQPTGSWSYTVDFENDGTAAAQDVTVTQQLDPSLDWSTFQLGSFGFGAVDVTVPAGLTQYQTTIAYENVDNSPLNVVVSLDFNVQTGVLTGTFTSLDPTTGQAPTGVYDGFLPPDNASGVGEGFIQYTVQPQAALPTATPINQQASVVFDINAPLATNIALNTIDAGPVNSSVTALPATETATSFLIQWSGQDAAGGSGIAYYSVYVSDDGGSYTQFQTNTTATSATFTGQIGHTYGFYSVATDNVGNVQPTPLVAQATTTVVSPLSITSLAAVSPNPRNTPVSSIDVTFSEPINLGTLTAGTLSLTDNGGATLINSGVSLTLVSGDTYAIGGLAGLTAAEGNYTLTVNAADIQDQNSNVGSGSLSTSWLMDTTPPTSYVNPLPTRGTSLSFAVSVTGSDPDGANGSPPSGVASYDIYASTNGGPWVFWTNVPASNPSATFTGQSDTTYAFYSIAHDRAGNIEVVKKPFVEASTYVPDLAPPVTTVDDERGRNGSTVNTSTGTFTLNITGSDPGASIITYFEVFASVDSGAYQMVAPAIPAGPADSQGNVHASIFYQGSTDGKSHTYAFYSIGIDAAGNVQQAPTAPNLALTKTFANAAPSQLQVTGLVVEHGAVERSYVRYLDVDFNESDTQSRGELTQIAKSVGSASPQILLYKYDLNGRALTKTPIALFGVTDNVIDHAIELDFGANGLGGSPSTTTADGYYELEIKLPNKTIAVHHFYRLLGDVTGDGVVDNNDLNEIAAEIKLSSQSGMTPLNADVTGAGTVTAFDLALATRLKGRKLGAGLSLG